MGILDQAGDVGSILAAIEAARAKGRVDQAGVQQNQARAAGDIYRTNAAVALGGPTASAKSAALGDQMANVQPFQWTGGTSQVGNIPVPQSTGGLTPANFGPSTRKAGADLATLSASRVASPSFNIPKPPTLAPLPESSGLDSVLGTASTIGSLLKALAQKSGGASGGPGGSGSSVDLGKTASAIKNWLANRNTMTPGSVDNSDWLSNYDPFSSNDNGLDGLMAGGSGSDVTGGMNPSVTTDTTFNGIPGGYPNSPEDPLSADPNWWDQINGAGGAGNDGSTGTDWWSE